MATKRVGSAEKPQDFYDYLLKRNFSEHEVVSWRAIPPGFWCNLPAKDTLPRLSIGYGAMEDVLYAPTRVQRRFHASSKQNCLMEGPRGTGKSEAIRNDAHMRAMSIPKWNYLILRRHLTDLRKSHLIHMKSEMHKLGGTFNKTESIAYYPNGSMGFFAYCDHLSDVMDLLSSQYGGIYFDEMTTFEWEMITKISACVRVDEDSGLVGFVKGGTNPLGVGAQEVKEHYILKTVPSDPEYNPDDYEVIHTTPEDNPFLDWDQYMSRLGTLSDKTRRAWRDGEWVNEGAYFTEFRPTVQGRPWHVTKTLPTIHGLSILHPDNHAFVRIYRSLDWGFRPDPAVCIWYAVLPNGHTIAFKERTWRETLASDVGKAIKRESEGMRVIATFADPSMFAKRGETEFSVGDKIEAEGVALTPSVNDRTRFGHAICDYLNTLLYDGNRLEDDIELVQDGAYPKLQILEENGRLGCPNLIRTFPDVRSDTRDSTRIADGGEDHWVVSCAYFCMGDTPPPRDPERPSRPRWMLSKKAFGKSFTTRL